MNPSLRFPDGFVWGTATASYQVEGAVTEDGRGPSIWDTFSAIPGNVVGGDTGQVACDHYHRWPQDLDLMSQLNIAAYRFSIAWPRVVPDGDGSINQFGLDHYSRLVDGLLERGITPCVTLYHWDLPQALQDKGGWSSRAVVDAFARYTEIVAAALGDRVPSWITLNEPWVASFLGYGSRTHAPGLNDGRAALEVAHHLLMAHGRAAQVLSSTSGEVGITLNLTDVIAAGDTAADQQAAQRVYANANSWFLDPLLTGQYPSLLVDWYGEAFSGTVQQGDMELIHQPLDFIGVNYYRRAHVVAGREDGPGSVLPSLDCHNVIPTGLPTTAMGWPVEPDGFRVLLIRISEDYPNLPAIYITENGAAYDDVVEPNGNVNDLDRTAFLEGYLKSLLDAIRAGVPVRGYYYWSFLDNFEWAEGYSKRFGLVRVDYDTQQRTPKFSAHRYAAIIENNALTSRAHGS